MQSPLSIFSLGRASGWLAARLGWSPLGRAIVIRSAEGPDSERLAGSRGRIVELDDASIVLELAAADASASTRMRLTPRHEGWTAHSLMLVPIAVVVEAGVASRSAIAVVALERGQRWRA